ncbi:MAG: hypothetical protein Q8K30_03620 [Candidatus Gracilibacteria bacterium]|nr:hypothetical protein [Candidatus Gracilibacteria bacterium]
MRIVATILIAMIFTLLGLLKFDGHLNFGTINLIGYDDTFNTNFGFIRTSADYIFYVPELIYNSKKDAIIDLFYGILNLDKKATYLSIVFFFFSVFSGILIYALKYFPQRDDKIYLVVGSIISYLLIVEFLM